MIVFVYFACSTNVKYKTKKNYPQSNSKVKNSNNLIEQKGKIYHYNTSYYGKEFHGRLTSSGEKYDMYDFTCAHKKFPFGTKLLVTDEETGKSVTVRVNDRGPFKPNRQLDLSFAAAKKIGLIPYGVRKFRVQVIK
ncbi:MAG: septal ring lytic transglycosylase RlpA family protein [Candidatus Cloacimonetes bacterium]|nr:septal ring lytic transglycosylase RlpA family protein [Candidatus Cloacimonadota bacterium]